MKALVLLLLLVVGAVHAESTDEWLRAQWRQIPLAERASMPSSSIPISAADRAMLDFARNPVARNRDINAAYAHIARRLSACTSTPEVANWYHYAYWASLSAGNFISRSEFRGMDWAQRFALYLGGSTGLISGEEAMAAYFAHTNYLIAVEMIPLGRHFLATYCNANSYRTFSGVPLPYVFFDEHLTRAAGEGQQDIMGAFRQYHAAITERNAQLRHERVTLAATLQVLGEQKRVAENVDLVFRLGGPTRGPIEALYRRIAASQGTLVMGRGLQVVLVQDVDARGMLPALASLELPEYHMVFAQHRLNEPTYGRFPHTAVDDWGDRESRFRFLVAMMRSYAGRPGVLAIP